MKNLTLNVIKAIASFLVVFIHCRFPGELGETVVDIARIAVPIFLLISGFFSYNNDEKKLKRKIKHIFLLMLIANIVYCVWKMVFELGDFNSIKSFVKTLIAPATIVKFVIFNDNPFRTHLWYFNAVLYCYIIMYLYIKFIKPRLKKDISKPILVGSLVLLLMYLVIYIAHLQYNIEKLFLLRNFIFVGIPFFYIGNFINKYNLKDKITNKILYLIMISSFILLIIESRFYTSEIYIFTIDFALSVFLFGIKNPNKITNKSLEKIGDKYSSYIYMYHPLIKDVIIKVYAVMSISSKILTFIQPVIILINSLMVSILISKIVSLIPHKKGEEIVCRGNSK